MVVETQQSKRRCTAPVTTGCARLRSPAQIDAVSVTFFDIPPSARASARPGLLLRPLHIVGAQWGVKYERSTQHAESSPLAGTAPKQSASTCAGHLFFAGERG